MLTFGKRLRYKDFHLAARPSVVVRKNAISVDQSSESGFREIATVKDFGATMEQHGLLSWWRRAMGYSR